MDWSFHFVVVVVVPFLVWKLIYLPSPQIDFNVNLSTRAAAAATDQQQPSPEVTHLGRV